MWRKQKFDNVNAVYMTACLAMTGSGGWPLTALLTPGQKPFWVGTYLPKGRLLHLLNEAARLWREDRMGLLAAGDTLTAHLRQEAENLPGTPSRELVRRAVSQFAQSFDERWGGLKGKSIPNPLHQTEFDREPEGMAALREQVYAYRLRRTALHRDDKALTAWNGLALAALAPFIKDYPLPAQGARYYLCRK